MRTCMDDMDDDEEGVFDRQAPRCARKSRQMTLCVLLVLQVQCSFVQKESVYWLTKFFHTAIKCPPLDSIGDGVITYTPENTPDYNLDTVATYSCNGGFFLDLSIGGSVTRTCVDDLDNDAEGVFDRQAPRCVRKSL